METETLTTYKSSTEMHLFEKNKDKSHLKNGKGLHDENSSDTEEQDSKNCVENKNNGSCNEIRDTDLNDSQVEANNKKDDTFDSDVEEEEEHVPLNIELTSDLEKSDDDLDDTNEQSTNYESDKEGPANTPEKSNVHVLDPLDTNNVNESKTQCLSDKHEQHGNSSNMVEDEAGDKTANNENSCNFNDNNEDYVKNSTSSNINSETDVLIQNDGGKENVKDELAKDESKTTELTKDESKTAELAKDKSIIDELAKDESETTEIGKVESKTAELAKDESKTAELAKDMSKIDDPAKDDFKLGEFAKDQSKTDELEKSQLDCGNEMTENKPKSSESLTNEKVAETVNNREKISNEQVVNKKELKNSTEETKKVKDNTDEMSTEKLLKINTEENPKNSLERTSGEQETSCSLLMETLTRKNDKEGPTDEDAREDDMDEAYFDPSLLCPDISMEVDEDPVITTNDAPPPPQDGNKSPQLYEPIFSTFVDEMTGAEVSLNLSLEEEALRQETYGERNPIQFTKIHCTACNVHLGSALDGQGNRFVHPLLKVLICKNCYHFYTSGEFEKDEDGSELYCRWCGQGGQVMCCSNCEMVFCKKCIRINFDRKKLAEIRDSDDWMCFRCNPSQLTPQRIHCAEFMEYVRREISRAATLENATTFMTTDNTQCCQPQKKKATDTPTGEPKKKKRKVPTEDPDYDPLKDREESASPQPSTSGFSTVPPKPSVATKPPNIVSMLPAQVQASLNANANNTAPRTGAPQFKPRVQVVPATANAGQRPKVSGPGYIKILPGGIRVPGNTPTPRGNYNRQVLPAQTLVPIQPKQQPAIQKQQPMRVVQQTPPSMKHEWFEKTVRAAARVNSNLSYTLTQLNRAQSNAQSVEALAVVHNKLQEILSTSINSLIQIRKNLRTEFISGIKNIRFPPAASKSTPAPAPVQKPSITIDDDVIFVSPPTSPVPPPVTQKPLPPQLSQVNLPPSLSITRKPKPNTILNESTVKANQPTQSQIQSTNPTPPVNKPSEINTDRPKTFLRVKSLTALQNVTSECITIPDDPLPPPPPLTPIQNKQVSKSIEVNHIDNTDVVEIIDDNKDDSNDVNPENPDKNNTSSKDCMTFNLTEPYLYAVKNVRIVIKKSTEIEEMVKKKFDQTNCDV